MAREKNPATPLRGVATKRTYQHAASAWRAGAVDQFYYGRRSQDDPTVVWEVNDVEYPRTDYTAVSTAVDVLLAMAGVRTVTIGPKWCGYAEMIVEYVSGLVTVERFTGHTVKVEVVREKMGVAA